MDYANLFLQEVVRLHLVSINIISDIDAQFTLQFWKLFVKGFGSKKSYVCPFIFQKNGQAEPTIQPLEDGLMACVIYFKGNWNDHLPLIEFSYKNSYHSCIQMTPYENIYGRPYRSLIR